MVIEPRVVAAGFARRWTGEAIELMTRSFHLWFGMAVLFCLFGAVANPMPPMAMIPFGLFFYFVSIEFAAASDEREVTVYDVMPILRTAAIGVIQDIWAKRWVFLLVVGIMVYTLYFDAEMQKKAAEAEANARPVDLNNIMTWLVGPASPLAQTALIMLFGTVMQGRTFALATLSYPLSRGFKMDDDQVTALIYKAFFKNLVPGVFLKIVPLMLLITVGLLLPVVMPFFMCFFPALSYVAYREIFIDGNGNQEPAKAKVRSVATQGAL